MSGYGGNLLQVDQYTALISNGKYPVLCVAITAGQRPYLPFLGGKGRCFQCPKMHVASNEYYKPYFAKSSS